MTFKQQAEKFLQEGATRKRNPLRPATLRTYKSLIENTLVPLIGSIPLQDVGNKQVSNVVAELAEQGKSPATIALNVVIIKKIRRSAVDEDGNQLHPITWNADVIDAPANDSPKQPTVSAQAVQDAISRALAAHRSNDACLYAILAGTGMRVAEARALKAAPDDGIGSFYMPTYSKIVIRQQMTRSGLAPTKTKAGIREIDLGPELNNFLIRALPFRAIAEGAVENLLFPDCENCYRDHLIEDGIMGGFHSFRRFRVTHLRMSNVPQPLIDFWDGHAAGTMSERYTKVAGEIEQRKLQATAAGIGFELPETI